VAERERSAGRSAYACAKVVAAWLAVDGRGADRSSVKCAIANLSPVLGADAGFVEAVLTGRRSLADLTLR